jgi:hypothetical protein
MDRGTWLRTAGIVLVTAIVVSAGPAVARTVADFARNAGHLGGLTPSRYQHACEAGTVAGYAQVPADVGSDWTDVEGYSLSLFEGGAYPGVFKCTEHTPSARHVSTGVYLVSVDARCGATFPNSGGTLAAVVTVNGPPSLTATYTTLCDDNDRGFEQQVQITTHDGIPVDAAFTIEQLRPVTILAP